MYIITFIPDISTQRKMMHNLKKVLHLLKLNKKYVSHRLSLKNKFLLANFFWLEWSVGYTGWSSFLIRRSCKPRRAPRWSFDFSLMSNNVQYQEYFHKYYFQCASHQDCEDMGWTPNMVVQRKSISFSTVSIIWFTFLSPLFKVILEIT